MEVVLCKSPQDSNHVKVGRGAFDKNYPKKQMVEFEKSEIICKAIKLIGAFDGTKKCMQSEYVLVRDLVTSEIFIDNGHRAGVISNMTYGEFLKTDNTGDDTLCLTVYHHKEARAGPIHVILSRLLYK